MRGAVNRVSDHDVGQIDAATTSEGARMAAPLPRGGEENDLPGVVNGSGAWGGVRSTKGETVLPGRGGLLRESRRRGWEKGDGARRIASRVRLFG